MINQKKNQNPQPVKASKREKVIGYATLYCLHMAEMYIQGCRAGESNDLNLFLKWLDKRFWEAKKELESRENWDVKFKKDDTYKMDGALKNIRQIEAKVGLEGIAKYIYALVRLFWEETQKSNSLEKFTTEFLPTLTKKLAKGLKI